MIRILRCAETRDLFNGKRMRRWIHIESVAMRKLAMLNRAAVLDDLRIPRPTGWKRSKATARDSTVFV